MGREKKENGEGGKRRRNKGGGGGVGGGGGGKEKEKADLEVVDEVAVRMREECIVKVGYCQFLVRLIIGNLNLKKNEREVTVK